VLQESLKFIKHSGSKDARIRLALERSLIVLEVADIGRGIPPGLLSSLGLGLPGMRERFRQLGGEFIIRSGSGGTLVRAEIPLGELRPRRRVYERAFMATMSEICIADDFMVVTLCKIHDRRKSRPVESFNQVARGCLGRILQGPLCYLLL
jgi:hypothetical protein